MLNTVWTMEAQAGVREEVRGEPGRGGSAWQHSVVNKRGVSSHADQVTAGNKRAIWIRWLSPYLRDQSPVTPSPRHRASPPSLSSLCVARRGTRAQHTSEMTCPSLLAVRAGGETGWDFTVSRQGRWRKGEERRKEERNTPRAIVTSWNSSYVCDCKKKKIIYSIRTVWRRPSLI